MMLEFRTRDMLFMLYDYCLVL